MHRCPPPKIQPPIVWQAIAPFTVDKMGGNVERDRTAAGGLKKFDRLQALRNLCFFKIDLYTLYMASLKRIAAGFLFKRKA